jgi:aminotransferase
MAKFIADRVKGLVQSDIRAMTRECTRAGGINLGQGVCRLPIEAEILAAAISAIQGDHNSYTVPEGIAPLRAAVAAKVARHNGIEADPESEIVVTAGTTAAYTSALLSLLNPGDGILFLEPCYGYHVGVASILGFAPRFLELTGPGFVLTEEELRRAAVPGTRAIVLCTPCNPTGRMLRREELAAVAAVAEDRDLLVITDEIYEFIRFDGRRHLSPASAVGLWPRCVSIMGLSKTYSVTGWRLGYAAAPAEMALPLSLVHDLCYICAPAPLQMAAITALGMPDDYYTRLAGTYQQRRNLMCSALSAAGLRPIVPEGSYFVLADIGDLGFGSAKQAAMALLESCGVAAVPGTAFVHGPAGDRFLRFCFAVDEHELGEACARLSRCAFAARAAS